MNARPIWTQSGISPKFIRSRVNGALISVCTKKYLQEISQIVSLKKCKKISLRFTVSTNQSLGNRSFGGNL